ncbi:MAG TPA: hypothetical protein VEB20_10790 [Azospirillaceae bacterium]|nr:hypothetical protein [Azospirillaceae bacterium]
MTKLLATAFCTLALTAAAPALADCQAVQEPAIPDGGGASPDEMTAVTEDVRRYVTDMNDYVQCLSFAAKEDPAAARKVEEAIGRVEAITIEFNRQLRTFKSRA